VVSLCSWVSFRIGRAVTGPVPVVVTGPVLMPVTGRMPVIVVKLVEMVARVPAATANQVDPHHDRHP
jgi:hypothetical protein